MKVWSGFGSEHSANLVLIGSFQTPEKAQLAIQQLEKLCACVQEEFDYERFYDDPTASYPQGPLVEMLKQLDLPHFSPDDIEHLARGPESLTRRDSRIEIRTDEYDVNGFLKFLLGKGARIEVYSAHDYPAPSPTDS